MEDGKRGAADRFVARLSQAAGRCVSSTKRYDGSHLVRITRLARGPTLLTSYTPDRVVGQFEILGP